MNGNCHFLFGAALSTAAVMNLEQINSYLPNVTATPETATLLILGGLIGSIIPDIDSSTSYIGKLAHPISKYINKISKCFGKEKEYHRGILHDPTLYIAGLVLSYLYFPPVIGLFLGCLSHLFLDMFNPAGISLFLGASRLSVAGIKSGSKFSIAFTWGLTLSVLAIGGFFKFVQVN